MAKGSEQNRTNQMAQQNYNRTLAEHAEDRSLARTREGESYTRQQQSYDPALAGYTNFATTGGLTDADRQRLRDTLNYVPPGSGGGGGPDYSGLQGLYSGMAAGNTIDQNALRVGMPTLKNLMETGGYDPDKEALIQSDIGELRKLGRTGGMTDTDINRYRGAGVFDEFANTGGLSNVDKQMLRARGTAGIASQYGQAKDELSRLARVQGGNTAGQGALLSRMTRDGARAAQDAARDTELGITDRVLEGRRWGAESMSTAEQALQDRLANTKLIGLGSATEHGRGIEEYKGKMKLDSSSRASEIESDIADKLAAERARGASGLAGILSAMNSGRGGDSGPSAADRLRLEQYMLEFGTGNQLAGLEGLGILNSNSLNEGESYRDFILGERGLTGNDTGQVIDQRIANNPRFNWGGVIGGALGAASGIGSSLIGRGAPRD